MKSIQILKASGEKEPFSERKLKNSLSRSGAPEAVIQQTVQKVESQLYPGMTTDELYATAFRLLKKHRPNVAARYSLKKSILLMGPSGHPFETLIAEVLRFQGFEVQSRQVVQGRCVKHELDVIAEKEGRRIMVECKFHHEQSLKVDIKTALYVQARFEDLHSTEIISKTGTRGFDQGWLVTNSKITSDATQYARCVGLQAIGWDYPLGGSLPLLIDRAGLHPVTSLTLLNKSQKVNLIEKGLVLCKDISGPILNNIGLSKEKVASVLEESKKLCQTN